MRINPEDRKQVLGTYVFESEGANFWLSVLTDLQNRGLEDILIAPADNLKGLSGAIGSIFPKTEVQSCIADTFAGFCKYVASKDQKAFMRDLKRVYRADTKDLAELALEELADKWESKYPVVITSWRDNWDKLATCFQYMTPIPRLIYTMNGVEGYHRQIRKVTKTKDAFTSDMALLKLVYLATKNIETKWTARCKTGR